MLNRQSFSKPMVWGFLLGALAVLPYLRLLKGEFFYDDIQAIWNNRELASVHSVGDVFAFVLKPTRPVSNFFLALGEWLSPRRVLGQRALTLLIHLFSTLLLWRTLVLLNKKLSPSVPNFVLFAVAGFFAINPLHSETLAIAQYRMDMLGTFFTLACLFAWLKKDEAEITGSNLLPWRILVFLCLGGATLSKEPFALVAPAALLLLCWVRGMQRKDLLELAILPLFWALSLYQRLKVESLYPYSFTELLGYSNLSPSQHLTLASHALTEGLGKVFTGHFLTIVRLHERLDFSLGGGVARNLPAISAFVLLCGTLLSFKGWWRFAGGLLLLTVVPYLAIPNINIGSEHYWYFGVAAIWLFTCLLLWKIQTRLVKSPRVWFAIILLSFGAVLLVNLERRVGRMGSRFDFYLAELQMYPRNAERWIDVAATLVDNKKKDVVELARAMLDEAAEISPQHPLLLTNEYYYSVKMGEKDAARTKYFKLMDVYHSRPRDLDSFRAFWKANFGEEPS